MGITKEEKDLLDASKQFAEQHNLPFEESAILNAYREGFKNGFEAYKTAIPFNRGVMKIKGRV